MIVFDSYHWYFFPVSFVPKTQPHVSSVLLLGMHAILSLALSCRAAAILGSTRTLVISCRPQRPNSEPQCSCCTHRNGVLLLSACSSTFIFGFVGKQGCGLFSLGSVSLFYCCQNKGGQKMHSKITAHTIIMCLECKTFCWWCIFVWDDGNQKQNLLVYTKKLGTFCLWC